MEEHKLKFAFSAKKSISMKTQITLVSEPICHLKCCGVNFAVGDCCIMDQVEIFLHHELPASVFLFQTTLENKCL